ncbi:MAG: sodium:proton antiporter NhaD [Reinekea forsetii]|jgi:NhaD family Na+/H+ antiporter|uniref:Na+/H+ antiporter NhaD type n=1 Tax=Reinekea forsetii TaxID=1336806 RepID=A0A2K8KTM6_9GAMM|nr:MULTISPECIES: sodium:proton antiporter NhaD [Reinekea]ATX76654.1 Na+/H+ antiporter NhaD type [Reinekea forsetii]MDO7643990.1 sodium:proton antiporter NhaD [Reinekea forsetii]MDO7674149.1 sodium:proton antiporter NhaD [Reinekea forsetii]
MKALLVLLSTLLLSVAALANEGMAETINLTHHWAGYAAMFVFVVAYLLVIFEEQLHLPKSKPVMISAGLIWILIAVAYMNDHAGGAIKEGIQHNFLEYAELFFFLLVAMTYINAMMQRGVFQALRGWLIDKGFSYRQLFWLTGILAFFISPVADNLTTALIMCAVVMAVGQDNPKFIGLSCINIVVAANAGGAFSPFGDITTLMVWQKGMLEFGEFFALFIPSVVNFVIPAAIMHFSLPIGTPAKPAPSHDVSDIMLPGGLVIVGLFILTIITAVSFHNFFHIPPVYGMMFGLGYLKMFGYYLSRRSRNWRVSELNPPSDKIEDPYEFDVFAKVAQSEWDTLFFFYGVIMSVGGLGFIGYLALVSESVYVGLGPTYANILVGFMSAIVDNIPVMFAVLTMNPEMSHSQWLLVTLTAGVGGSMLSIGSAAGVALMGQARGSYTFFSHLRWSPVIMLGYFASIWVHLWLNG